MVLFDIYCTFALKILNNDEKIGSNLIGRNGHYGRLQP